MTRNGGAGERSNLEPNLNQNRTLSEAKRKILINRNGAQKRTRTSTALRPLAPEASASTNSAIWARNRAVAYALPACGVNQPPLTGAPASG